MRRLFCIIHRASGLRNLSPALQPGQMFCPSLKLLGKRVFVLSSGESAGVVATGCYRREHRGRRMLHPQKPLHS